MAEECAFCGRPITNECVVAEIDWVKFFFCYCKRVVGKETCLDKFLIQHPMKYRFHEKRVQ
ncbi:hypothetical protein D4R49_01155 [bacterium]|nr:MAG: hypothetical protein D4R49_01155 [bacterium]